MIKFGEYLVKNKVITPDQLEKALIIQREENNQGYHRMIGYILLKEYEICSKKTLYEHLRNWQEKNL